MTRTPVTQPLQETTEVMKNLQKANLAVLISASLVTTALAGIACEDHYSAQPVNGQCFVVDQYWWGKTNGDVTPGGCGPSRNSSQRCKKYNVSIQYDDKVLGNPHTVPGIITRYGSCGPNLTSKTVETGRNDGGQCDYCTGS